VLGGSPLSGLLFKIFDTESVILLSNVGIFKQPDSAVSPVYFIAQYITLTFYVTRNT